MSMHEDISQELRSVIDRMSGATDISPELVANLCCDRFGSASTEIHMRYLAIEHAKAMARRILAAKFDPDGQENDAHQGDMFSGQLQERYPIMRRAGEDPVYRPLGTLSLADLDFNVQQLMKSADARVKHARALQAYRDRKIHLAA